MRSDDLYQEVLREFVAITGGDASALDSGSEVSFEFDGMLAFIFAHPSEEQVVVDVEIVQLQGLRSEASNLDRLALLHQLNSITRFSHGGMAHLSVDDMLMLSRAVPMAGLTGKRLAEVTGESLDIAERLRSTWSDLRALLAEAGEAMSASTLSPPLLSPSQFA